MVATIGPLQQSDRSQWEPLWAGYLAFYRTQLPPATTDATWDRLVGSDPAAGGLAAHGEAGMVGFLHYVLHPTTWSTAASCYLEDLYVVGEQRGTGTGRALIEHLVGLGRDRAWSGIHWITAADNSTGMRLYDRLAQRTTWVRYEIDLQA